MTVILLIRKYKDYYHGTIDGHQEINLQRRYKKVLLQDLMDALRSKLGPAMPETVKVQVDELRRRYI